MAKQRIFDIRVDVSELVKYSDTLATLTPDALNKQWVQATNLATESAYELSRKTILSGINLTEPYVARKMRVERATDKTLVASILAETGDRDAYTSLSHYGRMQLTTSTKGSKGKGHPGLSIEAGSKAAGISVEVVKGRRKNLTTGFSIAGKQDKEGNPLVFQRTGQPSKNKKGKVRVLLGPSVYQLFRVAIPKISDQVGEDLEKQVIYAAERLFQG